MCELKIRTERIRVTTRNRKESSGKEFEVVWASDVKKGALRRKEGDGNESRMEKEEKKA